MTTRGRSQLGCWVLLALVATGGATVLYGFWQIWSTVSGYERQYLEQGYELVEGNTITVTEPVTTNTYFYAREALFLEQGAQASVAISAHEATISGTVTGDVAFLGGDLEFTDGTVIEGSVDITMARHVVLRGTVLGELQGTWTRLFQYGSGSGNSNATGDATGTDLPGDEARQP
ncbi:MAG: hypothetical protein MK116_05885 [Phycisphaerales bacterium]|nr:hypothetical protein [Phycisphaerales bacterium]